MIETVLRYVVPAAYSLLPAKMNSPEATALLVAIGLQETRLMARRQKGEGPALSLWQFEPGSLSGFAGVFKHPATRDVARQVAGQLRYSSSDVEQLRRASEDNDILAAAIARLLLWTLPMPLPRRDEPAIAWAQYIEAWRPGTPRLETWASLHEEAWERLEKLSRTESTHGFSGLTRERTAPGDSARPGDRRGYAPHRHPAAPFPPARHRPHRAAAGPTPIGD